MDGVLSISTRLTVVAFFMTVVAGSCQPLATQSSQPPPAKWQAAPRPEWETAAGGRQEFDVVSVRQNKSGDPWSGRGDKMTMNIPYGPDDNFRDTGGLLSARNYPVLNLIVFAYKVPTAQGKALLASLPDWTNNDLFDIEARTENRDATKDQMRLMMQSLLADRFHLVIHRELRQVSEYAVILARPGKLGPNIRLHPADQPCSAIYIAPKDGAPQLPASDAHAFAGGFPLRCRTFGPGPATAPYLQTRGSLDLPIETIAGTFSGFDGLDRPVVDQTGLKGHYDWYIEYLPELPPNLPAGAQIQGRPSDASGPSFSEALRDQLGFKFVPTKGLYPYLIVDHIEHPSAN